MKIKERVTGLLRSLSKVWMEFPVETLLVLSGWLMAVLMYEDVCEEARLDGNLALVPMMFCIALAINRLCRKMPFKWPYWLTLSLVAAVWFMDGRAWVQSPRLAVAVADALLLLLLCERPADNRLFAVNGARVFWNTATAFTFGTVAFVLLMLIFWSMDYIFGMPGRWFNQLTFYSSITCYLAVVPLLFLACYRDSVGEEPVSARFLDVLFNYIITPALLIYTVILYVYMIKIAIVWELPKGGVAYMVFAFAMVALWVKMTQPLLGKRIYGWFFDRLELWTLPAVALFWWGVCRRVGDYGFTAWRVYLVVCGVIMTLGLAMMATRRFGRWNYVAGVAAVLLALFTFLPPVSALRIALRSQQARTADLGRRLGLVDAESRLDTVALAKLSVGSLSAEERTQLEELCEAVDYLADREAPTGLGDSLDARRLREEYLFRLHYALDTTEVEAVSLGYYLSQMGCKFDIRGYDRMYNTGYDELDVSTSDDRLKVTLRDEVLVDIPFAELLAHQLAAAGLDAATGRNDWQSHRNELLFCDFGRVAVIIEYMNVSPDKQGGLEIDYLGVGSVLLREE